MKDFVSSRRVSIVAAVASLLILWAIIAVPGGPPWAGLLSLSVMAVLLVATARLLGSVQSAPSMSEVIHGVDAGWKAGDPLPVTARSPIAR